MYIYIVYVYIYTNTGGNKEIKVKAVVNRKDA